MSLYAVEIETAFTIASSSMVRAIVGAHTKSRGMSTISEAHEPTYSSSFCGPHD
jgi:hypothetical protein